MKERPILFSSPMVQAILKGRKTQTRRVVKHAITGPNPPHGIFDWHNANGEWLAAHGGAFAFEKTNAALLCPYGQPGDRLWVREKCRADELKSGMDGVRYHADDAFIPIENSEPAGERWFKLACYGMKKSGRAECRTVPSIHMPRWASRILLEVTAVRVERLNDISDRGPANDCTAEGVFHCGMDVPSYEQWHGDGFHSSEKWMYRNLWESINGPGSWEANHFVWAIKFERVNQ